MSESVGRAYIEIRGDASKLSGDMKDAEAQIEKFAGAVKGIIAGYLSYGALKGFMSGMVGIADSTAEAVDQLGDFAEVSGMAVNQVSALKYVVEASGQSWGAVQGSIFRFSKALGGATEEGEDTAKVFDKLGIKVKGLDGQLRPTEEVLLNVADKFKGMSSASEKTAVAFQLFGRGCFEIIPILNLGSEGIKKLQTEAERLGVVLDAQNIAAVQSYFQTRTQFEAMIGKIKLQLGTELMPVLGQLATELQSALLGPDGRLLPNVKSGITAAVGAFKELASTVIAAAPGMVGALSNVLQVVNHLLVGVRELVNLLKGGAFTSVKDAYMQMREFQNAATNPLGWDAAMRGVAAGRNAAAPGMMDQVFGGMQVNVPIQQFKSSVGAAKQAVQELKDVTVPAFSTMAQSFSPVLGYLAQIVTKMYEAKKAADEALALKTAEGYMVSSAIDWSAIEALPERQMPALEYPDQIMGGIDFSLYSEESMDLVREQISYLLDVAFPGLGTGMEYMQDAMRELADTSESELQRVLMTTETFASAYLAAAETIGAAAGQIFGAGLSGGWKGLITQAITMIAQYFGKKLAVMGAGMIAEGSAEVIMGMNPLAPNPALVAHGAAMMKTGGVITAVGAALTAAAPAIGSAVGGLVGGNGSSSGSKSGSSSTSTYTSAAETATGYTYTVGGGTGGGTGGATGRQAVTININAMDSQSFNEYLQRNGSEGVTAIMERSYRSNGTARGMRTWG